MNLVLLLVGLCLVPPQEALALWLVAQAVCLVLLQQGSVPGQSQEEKVQDHPSHIRLRPQASLVLIVSDLPRLTLARLGWLELLWLAGDQAWNDGPRNR